MNKNNYYNCVNINKFDKNCYDFFNNNYTP